MDNQRIPISSPFDSVDPAPTSKISETDELRVILCNENERMFQRMRALFALRNKGGNDAVDALCAAFDSDSALLKHEIAYVLGQMQNSHAVPMLIERLSDEVEDLMVRHEAAEALGDSSMTLSQLFLNPARSRLICWNGYKVRNSNIIDVYSAKWLCVY